MSRLNNLVGVLTKQGIGFVTISDEKVVLISGGEPSDKAMRVAKQLKVELIYVSDLSAEEAEEFQDEINKHLPKNAKIEVITSEDGIEIIPKYDTEDIDSEEDDDEIQPEPKAEPQAKAKAEPKKEEEESKDSNLVIHIPKEQSLPAFIILNYLKLLEKDDNEALKNIVRFPNRGIHLERLLETAKYEETSLFSIIKGFTHKASNEPQEAGCSKLYFEIEELRQVTKDCSLADIIKKISQITGLREWLNHLRDFGSAANDLNHIEQIASTYSIDNLKSYLVHMKTLPIETIYRDNCYFCGKELILRIGSFNIYPPTCQICCPPCFYKIRGWT